MLLIALKMLMGDRARYIGIVVGVIFASLLITQQSAIFVGLMSRTYGFLTDTGEPDIWVMDETVRYVDDNKPLSDTELLRVRGVTGVDWAVPMYRGLLQGTLPGGGQQNVWLVGLDDPTLLGGPPKLLEGELADLRERDAVIIDATEGKSKLVKPANGEMEPLGVGDVMEINDHRAVIVGRAQNSRTFQAQPTVYTTYSRALQMSTDVRRKLSFVLVKAREGEDIEALARKITERTGLKALTRDQFSQMTYDYYLKETGIPINFGTAVIMGFVIGVIIAGQTFYNFTISNLRYFGTFKAMGASNMLVLRMILVQAFLTGLIGYGLGVGLAALFGFLVEGLELSFRLEWYILALTGGAVILICLISALISIRSVVRLEPAAVFRD